MNLSSSFRQSTSGLESPPRPSFSSQYSQNVRVTRNPTLLIGQISNSMIYYSRSSSERLQVPNRRFPNHSVRTRRRRSHSGKQTALTKGCVLSGSTPLEPTCSQQLNDSMIYLDGPQVYACSRCRTHLTSHDEIISKSFHGRHGRAFLFDHCVNVDVGPAEERPLMTGLHSVSDIFCKRCKGLVGWTYIKAYEASQKYKEGKFILEKINLHLETSDHYNVAPPPGEKNDRFRARSISWGSDRASQSHRVDGGYSHVLDLNDSKFANGGNLPKQQCSPFKKQYC